MLDVSQVPRRYLTYSEYRPDRETNTQGEDTPNSEPICWETPKTAVMGLTLV